MILSSYQIPSEIIKLIWSKCHNLTKFILAKTNKQFKLLLDKSIPYSIYICEIAASIGSLGI